MDTRDALRAAVRSCLAETNPELLAEFDVSFDGVFTTLERELPKTDEEGGPGQDDSLSFDAGVAECTLISLSCWVGLVFLRAALKDSLKRDAPRVLDALELKALKSGLPPDLVRKLRDRIEGILDQCNGH